MDYDKATHNIKTVDYDKATKNIITVDYDKATQNIIADKSVVIRFKAIQEAIFHQIILKEC